MSTLGQRIKKARNARGMSQNALVNALKMNGEKGSQGLISQLEIDKNLETALLPAIARVLNCSVDWLDTGEGDSGLTGSPVIERSDEGVHIPMLANTGGMGSGEDLHNEDVMTGSLTLSPHFIQERIRPSKTAALRFINSHGDSMSPTFESGDVLLVDSGVRECSEGGVYVLSTHGRMFIKRVSQRMDGCFTVSSDNPSEKTVEVLNGDHQVSVLGRVVWVWNGRKL